MGMGLDLSLAPGSGSGGASNLSRVLALTPSALFDSADATSIFQTRTNGSTGAAAAPVGIMLDRAQMGAATAAAFLAALPTPELATNGNFAASSDWTMAAGVAISGGTLNLTAANSSSAAYQAMSVSVGKWYLLTFSITSYTSGLARARCFGASVQPVEVNAVGTYSVLQYVDSANTNVGFTATTATLVIDNFTVKEISGLHALSASDSARPTLRAGPYVDFDGVDDVLNAKITSSLGASCSVYHRTQAGADVWLTSQTIASGDYALSTTDWVRAAIFNRALSGAEAAIVEAWGANP